MNHSKCYSQSEWVW